MALPESPSRMPPRSSSRAEYRPSTLRKTSLQSSLSRASTPKPSTPQPLKSILKGKTSPPHESYESDGEITADKNFPRNTVYTVPSSLPQNAHLGESLVQLILSFRCYVPYLMFRPIKVP